MAVGALSGAPGRLGLRRLVGDEPPLVEDRRAAVEALLELHPTVRIATAPRSRRYLDQG